MKCQFLVRLEPEVKAKFRKIAKAERRSMNSLILVFIDKKIAEAKERAISQ